MRVVTKIALGLVGALLTAGLGAGAVHAVSISIEPAGAIRAISLGKLTFTDDFIILACNMTLTGSLRTGLIEKTRGTSIGTITRVDWEECTGGEIEHVRGIPWLLTYQNILGSLPSGVTGVELAIERADFKLTTFGGFARCRYRADALVLWAFTGSNPYTGGLITKRENLIGIIEGFGCPSVIRMRGTYRVSPTQRIRRL